MKPIFYVFGLLVMMHVFGNLAPHFAAGIAPEPTTATPCPFDKFQAVWTGRTETVNGQVWFVMRCPQGHETLARSPH